MPNLVRLSRRAVLAVLTLAAAPALAWGQTGHRVIGELAEERISGRTAAGIALILGDESLAQASTFADEQRSNPAVFWQKEASPFHYVTVPQATLYAETGAPAEGDAVTALRRFAAVVRDRHASREERALALRFIVHIVGDLHQPLHAGNGTDKGGNEVKVRWFGENTNLHTVWDTKLLEAQNLSFSEYAARLARQITPAETLAWWETDPLLWIAESTALRDRVYPEAGDAVPNLGYAYQFEHIGTAEERLKQGGVRLAAYLDALFAQG